MSADEDDVPMIDSGGTQQPDLRVIVCNYTEGTNVVAAGSKAYVIPQLGGNLPERVRLIARSRGGRWVEKWESTRRLDNFRLATLPPEHPRYSDDRLGSGATEELVARLVRAKAEVSGG